MRTLTEKDVTFEVCLEPDPHVSEADIRGSFATDDPELDRRDADAIIARLRDGDESAWCTILVKATWGEFEADDSISGVTLGGPDDSPETYADEYGMKGEALERLNRLIAARRKSARKLLRETR